MIGGEGGEGKLPKKRSRDTWESWEDPAHPGLAAVPGVTSLCHLAAGSRMELRDRPGMFW